jgi:succinate-semialdehyde dehydrogenase / glutarate-semialdehyde dehydrogenase
MDMVINGAFVPSVTGHRQDVIDPRSGAVIDTVPQGDAQDADIAIQSAHAAFALWRVRPMADRVKLLKRLAQVMRDAGEAIGDTLHRELGRPRAAAVAEVGRAADLLDIYAEEGLRLQSTMPLGAAPGERTVVTRDPVGVVVAITPFNYPLNLLMFKLGAALVAGCTVVAKPAADTPLSTLMLADLFHRNGLPPGVFNVVTGAGRGIGEALVTHPVPRKVAFTGGTAAGKMIATQAIQTMKRVTLELGGQSAAIICADADIDKAAAAVARHGFANSGQFCYRVNRIYVERAVYDAFLSRLLPLVQAMTLAPAGGDGDLGPLVNEKIYRNAKGQVDDARAKGGRILCGGERQTGTGFDGGFYLQPTLIADATHDMQVLTEETFGPVLGICPVDDCWQGLRHANDNRYGLAGFVFTRDLARGLALCEGLEAGSVWLNDIQRSSHYEPFGGVKESGLGREKGRYGVEAYLEYKTMYLSWDVPS